MKLFYTLVVIATVFGCKQTENGDRQKQKNQQKKGHWFFWSVDWHPLKSQFAVGGSNDTFLKLFSTEDLQEIQSLPFRGTITKINWHPTENKLAIAVQDDKSNLSIYNFDSNENIELDSITNAGARAIGWNSAGNLLAVGDNDGFLSFFNENGKFLKKIDTEQKGLMDLAWHPEKDQILTVGEKITLYDFQFDSLKHYNDRDEKIDVLMLCVAWHPDGDFFVTGDYGDFVNNYPPLLQYWTDTGERIKSIKTNKAELRNLKWSNDGELLATASEKIRLWNKGGDLVAEKDVENLLWGIDWNKDGTKIVATDDQGSIIIWDKDLNELNEFKY